MIDFILSLFLNPLFFVCFFIGVLGILIANEPENRITKKKKQPK